MIKLSRMFLGVTLLGSMVACGGSGGDGGSKSSGAFRSSLVQNRLLAELPSEDSSTLCNELSAWEGERLTAALPEICRDSGWWAAQLSNTTYPPLPLSEIRASCTTHYDECMQVGHIEPIIDCTGAPPSEIAPAPSTTPFDDSCQVTVAEAEDCYKEVIEQYLASLSDSPDCVSIDATVLADKPLTYGNAAGAALGPACSNMKTKCPASFTDIK